jgi:N-methylhydantoinase B
MSGLDPITLEVIRNKLDDIADEMEITLLKSSHSATVKEALDASAAIFDPQAQQVAQATAGPLHLGMIIPGVRRTVELFPPETMREGDVYVLNDPYDGGNHLPDLIMTVPVFVADEPVALAVTITHHHEMGGRSPGSTPMDVTEIFQEGLRIPPLKLFDAGEPNATLISLIERNVRTPEAVIGDVYGQIAACHAGRQGLLKLFARYGKDALHHAMDALLDRAEHLTREAISRIPDGDYHFVDYLDNDGIDLDRQVRIEARVTIDGSDFNVDLTGTNPQVRGPINCVPASTLAAIYYVVRVVTDPAIPNNGGCYRPVQAILPEGSVVNPRPPAAVNARAVTVRRLVDAMLGALAPALPARIPAASNGHPLVMSGGGVDPADGRAYAFAEFATGGMGGRPNKDGVETIQTDTSNAQNIPVEALELESPLQVAYLRLRPDSGGPGRYRGGLGFEKRFQVLRGELRVSHRGERHYSAPWGLAGGEAGASCRSLLRRAGEGETPIPSKLDFVMRAGDELDVWTSGGGGHGDPLDREPERVLADVLDGKVGAANAAEQYGVVVVDGAVHGEATIARRADLAARRGAVTWTYDRGRLGRE